VARQRISAGGWVVFGTVLGVALIGGLFLCIPIFFAPLCVLGLLLMKEDYRVCGACLMKIG